MGDKITAKSRGSRRSACPVVPGIARARPDRRRPDRRRADEIGFPVLVKPSAGGGGKGMRVVRRRRRPARRAGHRARREAAAAFGDDTLFLERFVLRPQAYRGAGPRRRAMATSCIWVSASAACSAATRRSSRRPRHRCWTPRRGPGSARQRAIPPAASTTPAPARWSSSSRPTGPTSSSSWR